MQPYEIIGVPFDVYLGPVGESFPSLDTSPPGGNWALLGKNGDKNMSEDGVSVQHNQTMNDIRPAGTTGPVKTFRTEEDLIITFTLWDLTLEMYAEVLNSVTVSDTAAGASTAGYRDITLRQGLTVNANALLIRGVSAYDESWLAQYQIPRVYQGSSPEVIYTKGTPAGLLFEYHALEDLNASTDAERFGKLLVQDAAPTG